MGKNLVKFSFESSAEYHVHVIVQGIDQFLPEGGHRR